MSTPSEARELVSKGQSHYKERAYKKALVEWKQALEIYEREGKKREVGIISIYMTQALVKLGQHKEALVTCTQAVRILREVNEPSSLRTALLTMGRIMDNLGYVEEANRAFSQALEIQVPGEEKSKRVSLLIESGRLLAKSGSYQEGSGHLATAVKMTEQIDDTELRGEALTEYSRILQQLAAYDEAKNVQRQLIQLWGTAGKPKSRAHALLGLANIYQVEGYLDKAEELIEQARVVFSKASDETGLTLCEFHTARLLLEKGQPEQALPHGEAALQFFQKQKKSIIFAESALVVAQILDRLVQDVRALRLFDKAIEIFSQLGEQARSMQAHISKGKALLRLGKDKQSEQEFTQAIRYYQEHKRQKEEARIYIEVGETFYQLGRYPEAIEQSKMALLLLQNHPEEKLEIQGYRLLLNASRKVQRLEEELPFLQKAVKEANAKGRSLLATSLMVSLTQLNLDTQSPEQVKGTLEQAIHDEQLPMELRAEAALNLGLVLMRSAEYTEAAQYLSQAIKEFRDEPCFDISGAYYQLAEAYHNLEKPSLRKDALKGALSTLGPSNDEKLQGRVYFELAPLVEAEDSAKALDYYEKAARIFSEAEHPEEYYQTLLRQANLLTDSAEITDILKIIDQAIVIGEELDIPTDFSSENLPLSWNRMQHALEEAILIATHYYQKQNDRMIVDKVIDWSSPRKIAKLQPYLADNLGFERCVDLPKLLQEETNLLTQISVLRQQLAQLSPKSLPQDEYKSRQKELRAELTESLEKMNVNRNVIAAACPDPGRGMLPSDYKMPQKLVTLMPPDRRWILINYDVLLEKQRIVVTTLDHVGRHSIHTLPITPDLASVVQSLQAIKNSQELPPIADLRDIASFLYRSLIPSRLERELQSHNYGFLQFITDGFLNNVPFELVFDGKEYWGLKYPMAWAPDFQFFESTLKTKALAQTGVPSVVLGVNLSSEEQASRREVAEEIAKSFLASVPTRQGVTEPIVLFGSDFTRTLLSSNLEQPRSLLYFSTPTTLHHRKGEIPLQQPDSLRVIEIGVTTLFKGAPILVLDNSMRMDPIENGMSLAGFLRHLVTAGSPSIVFTRWRPERKLQPTFTQNLIRQLYGGDPIAVAMLHTRRKLASIGPPLHSWLSYSLCGNPFLTLI